MGRPASATLSPSWILCYSKQNILFPLCIKPTLQGNSHAPWATLNEDNNGRVYQMCYGLLASRTSSCCVEIFWMTRFRYRSRANTLLTWSFFPNILTPRILRRTGFDPGFLPILTLVSKTLIFVDILSLSVSAVLFPLPLVFISVWIRVDTVTVPLSLGPGSLVHRSVGIPECPLSWLFVFNIFTFIPIGQILND